MIAMNGLWWVSWFNCNRIVIRRRVSEIALLPNSGCDITNFFLLVSSQSGLRRDERKIVCDVREEDKSWWWHQNTTLQLVEWHILLFPPPLVQCYIAETCSNQWIYDISTSSGLSFTSGTVLCSKGQTHKRYILLMAGWRKERFGLALGRVFASHRTAHSDGMWMGKKWTSNLATATWRCSAIFIVCAEMKL